MNKRFWILGSALCAAAMFALVCTDVKFDNPIDERGDNCEVCKKYNEMVDDGQDIDRDYMFDNWFNPEVNAEWQCDKKLPEIGLKDGSKFTLYYANPAQFLSEYNKNRATFDSLMGNPISGRTPSIHVDVTWGLTNGNVESRLVDGSYRDVEYSGMPKEGDYLIEYTAVKATSCNDTLRAQVYRELTVKEYIDVDTTAPTISLIAGTTTFTVGSKVNDPGVTVDGGADIRNVTRTLRNPKGQMVGDTVRNNGQIVNRIGDDGTATDADTGSWTIGYRVCKTLRYPDDGGEKDSCVSVTRTIEIKAEVIVVAIRPVIVLHNYKMAVSGTTYEIRDTTFADGGTFRTPGAGDIKEVFYMKDGSKVNIPIERVVVGGDPPGSTGGNAMTREKTYTLPSSPGEYNEVTTVRRVYISAPNNACDADFGDFEAPTVNLSNPNSGPVTIPADIQWQFNRVTNTSNFNGKPGIYAVFNVSGGGGQDFGTPGLVGVDMGDLDPYNPQPGTYTITGLGRSPCNVWASPRTREVKVE